MESLEDRRLLTADLTLVRDIHPNPQEQSGMINPIQVGDYLYFARESELYGLELWKSDGTPAGTVMLKDIYPGRARPIDSGSQIFTNLTDVNGTLYFRTSDGAHGFELWKTDGTPDGTQMVKDIRPGSDSSIPASPDIFANVNGTLFFAANDGVHGLELWKTDGTELGTTMVKDIAPAGASSSPRALVNVNGTLFFQANDGTHGRELWKSDGTPEGTVLVKDIRPGSGASRPNDISKMENVDGVLYFIANDGTYGYELWRSDGTPSGTTMVKDIRPGFGQSNPTNPTKFANVNGTLFFSANDGATGYELWKSDGTPNGTVLVKDIHAGWNSSYIANLTNVNGLLFFIANDGSTGTELWRSDGTAAGTVLVKDIHPGSESSIAGYFPLVNFGGTLFFVANDGTHGPELWKSDSTGSNIQMLTNIFPVGAGGNPRSLIGFKGEVYFDALGDIWKTDGTPAGTQIAIPKTSGGSFLWFYENFEVLGGNYFFGADDGVHGRELWKTDGSTSGTVLVKDINPGIPASQLDWSAMGMLNGELLFLANDGTHGFELWKSDGTAGGTGLLRDIFTGAQGSFPMGFTNANGTLFFQAEENLHGRELWRTDGTQAGTTLFKDIRPGPASSGAGPMAFLGDTLYLFANDGISGRELWKSDGTGAGTVLVKDIRPGSNSSNPCCYGTEVNGVMYFVANNGIHGEELWRSDGTADGTTLVKDIRPGSSSSNSRNLVNINGTLFFEADDGIHGSELWKSDGTAAGTVMVKNIHPGTGSIGAAARVMHLVNINGTLYFSANDGIHGEELWTSDGTTEGTKMVANLTGDSGGSNPRVIGDLGDGKLLVLATTAAHGRELYMLDLASAQTSIQAAAVYHAGSSFAGSGIQNALDTSKQLAKEGNEPLTLTYDNLINSSRGINGLVFDIQNLPGSPSSSLSAADFEFQMSPTGAFIEAEHPPANWSNAPAPSSISVVAGSQGSPDRVVLQWPDNAIANRWLRITVKATANTGLPQPEVYYIGHLLGETTGASGGVYTVSFADITPIRSAVGQSVSASSIHDIDKNGTVAFADISAMRPNVGAQLTNITIPAGNASSGESGGERLSSPQSGTGKGRVGGAGGWSLLQMPAVPMSSTLPTTTSRLTANRPDVIQTHSGLPENKPLVKAEGVETRDSWLGELDVLLEDAAIVRYWTSDSAIEEEAGIELLRLSMESSLKSRIAPTIQ
jgi:ELWxxDGT repeat protein